MSTKRKRNSKASKGSPNASSSASSGEVSVGESPRASSPDSGTKVDVEPGNLLSVLNSLVQRADAGRTAADSKVARSNLATDPILVLCALLRCTTQEVIKLAGRGDAAAVFQIWESSSELIRAVHALALQKPSLLKPIARKALFLPSFRAKAKKFTHNFETIQKNIELSKDCYINMDPAAEYDLESDATFFVAEKLGRACRTRERLCTGQGWFDEVFSGLDKWLLEIKGFKPEEVFLRDLPDYDKGSSPIWWEKVIKPYLEAPETLDRIRGTPFYSDLCKGAMSSKGSSKDYAIRDELKKRCKRKVLQSLAPAVSHKPPWIER